MQGKKLQYLVAFIVLALVAVMPLSAEMQVVLKNIKGKVEIKPLNSTTWSPAEEGMTISTMTTVSTGFDASVTIEMDKNSLFVKPLTRMTIDKLVESQGSRTTNCYLRVGNVKATVNTAEGVKQDFKVQSPYSTASVRGCEFDYSGLDLVVQEGLVALIPGRPVRDIQLPVGMEGIEPPDLSEDFAGSPDAPAVEGVEFMVPAGFEAEITINPDGSYTGSESGDREALESGSTVTTSDSGSPAGTTTITNQNRGIIYGSVTISVTLPE